MTTMAAAAPRSGRWAWQLRALGTQHRRLTLLLAGMLALAVGTLTYVELRYNPVWPWPIHFASMHLFFLVAYAWPVEVWRGLGPSERDYFWSLPVEQSRHELERVAAGALWLLAVLVAVALVSYAFALATGSPLMPATGLVGELLSPSSAAGGGRWMLVQYFISPFILYLLASAVALRVDQPGRWLLMVPVAITAAAPVLHHYLAATWIWAALEGLFAAPYGIGWAVGGPALHVLQDTAAPTDYATEWLPAVALWLALGGLALWLAARTRRET